MDETNRKRKHSENQDDDPLALCLSPSNCRRLTLPNTTFPSLPPPPPPPPPLPPQPQHLSSPPPAQQPPLILPRFTSSPSAPAAVSAPVHQLRPRRNRSQGHRRADKSNTVDPPFPWATDRRATVHSLIHLRSLNITEINGEVQCRRCDARQVIRYDLATKFAEVASFVLATKHDMHDRAPNAWMNPSSSNCQSCGQPGSVRPVIAPKKRSINWLFLLLGQTLGLCTLDQLKYFCKHTQNHRTRPRWDHGLDRSQPSDRRRSDGSQRSDRSSPFGIMAWIDRNRRIVADRTDRCNGLIDHRCNGLIDATV